MITIFKYFPPKATVGAIVIVTSQVKFLKKTTTKNCRKRQILYSSTADSNRLLQLSSQEEAGTGLNPYQAGERERWHMNSVAPLICPLMDGENCNCVDWCEEHASPESRWEAFSPQKVGCGRAAARWAMVSGLHYYPAELWASASSTSLHILQCQATTCNLFLLLCLFILALLIFSLSFLSDFRLLLSTSLVHSYNHFCYGKKQKTNNGI